MEITFIFGNGFDMRMGLKTGYKDVESNYIGLEKEDPDIVSFQKSLSGDKKYWSNFELAMGQYTEVFKDDEQKTFRKCMDDFTHEMISYLSLEEIKINCDKCADEIKEEFAKSLRTFFDELNLGFRNSIQGIIGQQTHVKFNFLTFNYTHIIDKCADFLSRDKIVCGSHIYNGTQYNHFVNSRVIHVHGELPNSIVLGVDNPSQIKKQSWQNNRRFLNACVKPNMNKQNATLDDVNAQNVINSSTILCVMGMSLGETDKTWWKYIGSWLKNNPNNRLILFVHDNSIGKNIIVTEKFDIENQAKDRFIELADISANDFVNIESKIYVVINSKKFDINLVELTKTKQTAEEMLLQIAWAEASNELQPANQETPLSEVEI